MSKRYFLLLILLSSSFLSKASSNDSTIQISSANIIYEFRKSKAQNSVEVNEKSKLAYLSTAPQDHFTFSESYNDQINIDDVEFKMDGRSPFNFKPQYSYYSVENIFYSDSRVCFFPVDFPKAGSLAKVNLEKTVKDPRYFTSIYFTDRFFNKRKEVSIIIPRWMKVELKEMNFGSNDIKKTVIYDAKRDADIITFIAQNMEAEKSEENSPGPSYIYPHLLVLCKSATLNNENINYFNNLTDQYAWYLNLIKSPGNDIAILKQKALELTKDFKTDIEKIKAVFYYVQKEVRYIAFEDGIAGFKPEKADEVLRKKYGDCKGMAHLTKELLVALGYDARLCWLGTKHIAYDYSTPSMSVDNHMICALFFKNKTYFLDATETYIGFNEYAERIQGRQVLIENGDKYLLSKVPVADASQNIDYEKRILSVSGTSLTGEASHQWKGEEKEFLVTSLNNIKKEKSGDSFKKYLSNHNSDYLITDLVTSDLTNIDTDLTATYQVNHKNAVNIFSKAYYIDIDFRKDFASMTIDTADRAYDYWFDYKTSTVRETELNIPENYDVSVLPPNLEIKNANYEFNVQFKVIAGKVLYTKTILLKNPNLSKSAFKQWNSDIDKLKQNYSESLILKQKPE